MSVDESSQGCSENPTGKWIRDKGEDGNSYSTAATQPWSVYEFSFFAVAHRLLLYFFGETNV